MTCLKSFKPSRTFYWIVVVFIVSGCSAKQPASSPSPRHGPPPQTQEADKAPEQPRPRVLASLQLTEQGRVLLERGYPDDAMTMLERSINLNPTNGQNYYYMAQAWLLKGNTAQAEEFNSLAETYLKEDPDWMRRIIRQKGSIQKLKKRKQ